jgi:hypothetical protein
MDGRSRGRRGGSNPRMNDRTPRSL